MRLSVKDKNFRNLGYIEKLWLINFETCYVLGFIISYDVLNYTLLQSRLCETRFRSTSACAIRRTWRERLLIAAEEREWQSDTFVRHDQFF